MKAVLTMVHRLQLTEDEYGRFHHDEFDEEPFGVISRLARLQDLLTGLRRNGVNVVAGAYTRRRRD